jgi:3-hydroxyacyl-[acyl-carrier-protein] dehydratase
VAIFAEIMVDPSHPALPGHFPGAPVVPGVLVLERVIAAAEHGYECGFTVRGVRVAKFQAPLLPGETARARIDLTADRLDFEVDCDGRKIASGSIAIERVDRP